MQIHLLQLIQQHVVPHAGDVDRNVVALFLRCIQVVVPHAGDVDRNSNPRRMFSYVITVVPHAGDVDRNIRHRVRQDARRRSSPTRGTWIEIGR